MAIELMEFLGNFQLKEEFTIVLDEGSYFAGKLAQEFSLRLRF